MPQICVRFSEEDYAEIDQAAADSGSTRPRVVARLVAFAMRVEREGFREQQEALDSVNMERELLTARVEALENDLRKREDEIGFLRQEYSKINEALSQRLLEEAKPKKSWWDRIRGR